MSGIDSLPFKLKIDDPSLSDVLAVFKKDIFLTFNCIHLATVKAVNPENKTLTCEINYGKTLYRQEVVTENGITSKKFVPYIVDYPTIFDCPYVTFGGGKGAIRFPIEFGDQCLVLFNDRDMDNWAAGSRSGSLNSPRLHSFADAIALVGLLIGGAGDPDKTVLEFDTTKITLKDKIKMTNAAGKSIFDILTDLNTTLKTLVTTIQAITVASVPIDNSAAFIPITNQLNVITTEISGLFE